MSRGLVPSHIRSSFTSSPSHQVFSASSGATDDHSCRLRAGWGTSRACPAAAGAAALVSESTVVVGLPWPAPITCGVSAVAI